MSWGMLRDRFPWITVPTELRQEISQRLPHFLLQESWGDKKGQKLMRCTSCGCAGVHDAVGKNRSHVLCPFCLETVEAVDHLRLKCTDWEITGLRRHAYVLIFLAIGGVLWAIDAAACNKIMRQSWDGPDVYTDFELYPFRVYRFEPGAAKMWRLTDLYDRDKGWYAGWAEGTPSEPQHGQIYSYGGYQGNAVFGWDEAIGETSCRYCGADDWFINLLDGTEVYGLIRYLREWCKRPKLELAVKWGLKDVVEELLYNGRCSGRMVNWRAETPWDFLKIPKQDWKRYRESKSASVELLDWNRKNERLPIPELLDFADRQKDTSWTKLVSRLLEKGIPFREQRRYLDRQSVTGTFAASARYWLDYLGMAAELGRDASYPEGAAMPRSLIDAHEEMVELRNAMEAELAARNTKAKGRTLDAEHPGYMERRERLEKKYAYRSGGLEIRVPERAEDILREGNVLKICVGGYAARHLAGKTTILFLRRARKPETPYICIELEEKTNKIVQIHGYKNENYGNGRRGVSPAKRYKDFLREWLAWVKAGSRRDKQTDDQRKAG